MFDCWCLLLVFMFVYDTHFTYHCCFRCPYRRVSNPWWVDCYISINSIATLRTATLRSPIPCVLYYDNLHSINVISWTLKHIQFLFCYICIIHSYKDRIIATENRVLQYRCWTRFFLLSSELSDYDVFYNLVKSKTTKIIDQSAHA